MDILFTQSHYCESDAKLRDTGSRQGGDVVSSFIEKCDLQRGCCVTFDNLFKSLSLFDVLWNVGLVVLVPPDKSVRKMLLYKLPSKQAIKKTKCGSCDCPIRFFLQPNLTLYQIALQIVP